MREHGHALSDSPLPLPLPLLPSLRSALPPLWSRVDTKLDTRALWMTRLLAVPAHAVVPLLYPRMLALHTLLDRPEVRPVLGCRPLPPPRPARLPAVPFVGATELLRMGPLPTATQHQPAATVLRNPLAAHLSPAAARLPACPPPCCVLPAERAAGPREALGVC